jgi:hypothetical protein
MKVLIDTSIWSHVLRRIDRPESASVKAELASLVVDGRVAMIGPIRQEVLSGIKERPQYDRLRGHLKGFPDTQILSDDYDEAASFHNLCRGRGIQGSHTDFLICAVAVRKEFSIFSLDADFTHFAKVLPIVLYDR